MANPPKGDNPSPIPVSPGDSRKPEAVDRGHPNGSFDGFGLDAVSMAQQGKGKGYGDITWAVPGGKK